MTKYIFRALIFLGILASCFANEPQIIYKEHISRISENFQFIYKFSDIYPKELQEFFPKENISKVTWQTNRFSFKNWLIEHFCDLTENKNLHVQMSTTEYHPSFDWGQTDSNENSPFFNRDFVKSRLARKDGNSCKLSERPNVAIKEIRHEEKFLYSGVKLLLFEKTNGEKVAFINKVIMAHPFDESHDFVVVWWKHNLTSSDALSLQINCYQTASQNGDYIEIAEISKCLEKIETDPKMTLSLKANLEPPFIPGPKQSAQVLFYMSVPRELRKSFFE